MTGLVLIRRFQPGDEGAVRSVVAAGAMVTVNPLFIRTATKEMVPQVALMSAAVLFVALGAPLLYSVMSLPAILLLVYIGVWIGHKIKIMSTHQDLQNINATYVQDSRCGLWVAELLTPEDEASKAPANADYYFVNEPNDDSRDKGKIIGTIAICVKQDVDMKDPPGSVAWLSRMAVDSRHQRRGVGTALLDTVVEHCSQAGFRAVELRTSEYHDMARSLYTKKGFELIGSRQKPIGMISMNLYTFRRTLLANRRSQLNAKF